jgi:uncharacterized protein YjbI with pentapeptide repeats
METRFEQEEPQKTATMKYQPSVMLQTEPLQTVAPIATVTSSEVVHTSPRRRRRFWKRTIRVLDVYWWRFVRRERNPVWKVFLSNVLAVAFGVSIGWLIHGWGQIVAGLGQIKVDGKSAVIVLGPAFMQILAGLIAGSITLWQFLRSHRQRDEHLARTQRLAQRQADQKERTDRELARQKELTDREHFRSKELQDQFGDIQNRLASPEPIIRANAALRLAQFGETLKPGVEDGEPRTKENNPYFLPVASQLATALYLEPSQEIRRAIREAIKNLVAFTPVDGDQPLLHGLIERLADANRTAKENFIRAFADWSVSDKDWQEMMRLYYQEGQGMEPKNKSEPYWGLDIKVHHLLSALAPFDSDEKVNRIILEDLKNDDKDRDADGKQSNLFDIQQRKTLERKATLSEDEWREAALSYLSSIETAAQQLIDTRDVLAEALKALNPVLDFLTLPKTGEVVRKYRLRLNDCFLAGADLEVVNLQGAYLANSYLQGVNMWYSKLNRAFLYRAHMQSVNLYMAELQKANLQLASMEGARLRGAELGGAILYGIHVSEKETNKYYTTSFSFEYPFNPLDVADFSSMSSHPYEKVSSARTARLKEWLAEQRDQGAATKQTATDQP